MPRRALSIAFTALWLTLGGWNPFECAGAFLAGLFSPLAAGGTIDPDGRPAPPPGEFGSGIDPDGRPAPPPGNFGSTIDPDGRPAPPPQGFGADIDPDGHSFGGDIDPNG